MFPIYKEWGSELHFYTFSFLKFHFSKFFSSLVFLKFFIKKKVIKHFRCDNKALIKFSLNIHLPQAPSFKCSSFEDHHWLVLLLMIILSKSMPLSRQPPKLVSSGGLLEPRNQVFRFIILELLFQNYSLRWGSLSQYNHV